MKKILFLLLVTFLLSMSLFSQTIKIVNTTYEESLLESIGIKDYSPVTKGNWYFSTDGIDKTAEKMLEKLPDDEPVILYGISLGGTVSRRMTQIANEKGKNVKGYIAQSSPLSGDRLTNTAWASTSLAMLGIYSLVGANNLFWGLPLEDFFKGDSSCQNYDFYTHLDDKTRTIINNYETIRNKKIDRSNEQSVIENATLPLLNAILCNDENSRGVFDYFEAVFSKGNNVKDLDPTGDFMVKIMNNSSSLENEATDKIKRAFIVSTNGNLYETATAWGVVKPVLTFYKNQRDSYWAKAKSQWWLFAYWSLRAAASSISIATVEGLPRAWSVCVSGSFDYSTNDGFVPADDTFWGKKLQMIAPNMRDTKYDKSYPCNKVSHLDYGENFSEIANKSGRTYSRKKSLEQQQKSLLEAVNFVRH
jgi:hypothetical protein